MKDYPAAIGEYQKAIELDPKLHLAYNDLGFTLLQLQKFGSARLAYEQAVELRLQWALARGGLGTTFMRTDGTYKVARGLVRAIKRFAPQVPERDEAAIERSWLGSALKARDLPWVRTSVALKSRAFEWISDKLFTNSNKRSTIAVCRPPRGLLTSPGALREK